MKPNAKPKPHNPAGLTKAQVGPAPAQVAEEPDYIGLQIFTQMSAEEEQEAGDLEAAKIYGDLHSLACNYPKLRAELVQAKNELKEARKDSARLESVRIEALRNVGYTVGAIPEDSRGQLCHAFLMYAHRILATGESDGVLKTDAAMLAYAPDEAAFDEHA